MSDFTGSVSQGQPHLGQDYSSDTRVTRNLLKRDPFTVTGVGKPMQGYPVSGVRRSVSTVHAATRRTMSAIHPTFRDIWYDNVIIEPSNASIGTISAPFEFTIIIWNGFSKKRTFTVSRTGWVGIDDNIPGSITLEALAYRTYTVNVTMDGPSSVSASLSVNSSVGASTLSIVGTRGVVWGFIPQSGAEESWEWLTEVQTAWDRSERRLALRDVPRTSYSMKYLLKPSAATLMDMMVYELPNFNFSLPMFEQAAPAQAVNAGAESIPCDVSRHFWSVGEEGVIWSDPRRCELFTVSAIGASSLSVETPLSNSYSGAVVVPCTKGFIEKFSRRDACGMTEAEATFTVEDVPKWEVGGTPTQIDGRDFWDIPAQSRKGGSGISRTVQFDRVIIDGNIGPRFIARAADYPSAEWTATIFEPDRAGITSLRGSILRRQGMARPFWTSTGRRDIVPSGTLRANSSTLEIEGSGTNRPFITGSRRQRILIEMRDGTMFHRTVRAISRKTVELDNVEMSEALSTTRDYQPGDFLRISFVTLVRLASDTVRWKWKKGGGVELSFKMVEVDA